MKILLTSISFMLSVLMNQSSCNSGAPPGDVFIPLAVGNYWVYRDSVFEDGKFSEAMNDTVKIISEDTFQGKKTFQFNNGKEWFASGDTIMQLSRQRTGFKFPSPVFIASETVSEYNFVYGGDVVMTRTTRKISAPSSSSNSSSAYYIVTDQCQSFWILARGIGVVSEKDKDCFNEHNNYTTKTLIDFKVK